MVKNKRAKKTDTENYLKNIHLETLSPTPEMIRNDESTGSTIVSDDSSDSTDCPEICDDKRNSDNSEVPYNRLKWVRRRTVCGTAGYRPPEQVQERFTEYSSRNGYDERADWFSMGVCCYMMLTGRRPFPTRKELQRSEYSQRQDLLQHNIESQIQTCTLKDKGAMKKVLNDAEFRCLMFEVNYPEYFDDEQDARKFINDLLCRNPDNRLRYEGIVKHPWMKGVEFTEKAALQRPIPQWVKDHAYLHSIHALRKEGEKNSNSGKSSSKPSLQSCIENLCRDCYNEQGSTSAENFASKWLKDPSKKTVALFRHWEYISEDAMKLEVKAAEKMERRSRQSKGKFSSKKIRKKIRSLFMNWR